MSKVPPINFSTLRLQKRGNSMNKSLGTMMESGTDRGFKKSVSTESISVNRSSLEETHTKPRGLPSLLRRSSIKSEDSDEGASESNRNSMIRIDEEDVMLLCTPRRKLSGLNPWRPASRSVSIKHEDLMARSKSQTDFTNDSVGKELHEHSYLRIFNHLISAIGESQNDRFEEIKYMVHPPLDKDLAPLAIAPDSAVEHMTQVMEECAIWLTYQKKMRAAVRIQTIFRTFLAKRKVKKWLAVYATPQILERNRHLHNLYQSEIKSLAKLHALKEYFYEPLKENGLLDSKNLAIVFGNFNSIFTFHRSVFDALRNFRKDWPCGPDKIGAAFLFVMPFMNEYIKYAQNIFVGLDTLQFLAIPKSKLANFIQDNQNKVEISGEKFTLEQLLSAPLNDFQNYEQTLNQILLSTPDRHPQVAELNRAHDIIANKALQIQEVIISSRESVPVGRIQRRLEDAVLVAPQRSLVAEREVKKVIKNGEGVKDCHSLTIFNESVMFATKTRLKELVLLENLSDSVEKGKLVLLKFKEDQFEIHMSSEKDAKEVCTLISETATKYRNKHKAFGVPLEVVLEREKTPVPAFLRDATKYLLDYHRDTEGIFRTSGNQLEILELRKLMDDGVAITFNSYSPHAVASVVKSWFRMLPEPLIPAKLYEEALKISKSPKEARVKWLKSQLDSIAESRMGLLTFLCTFLEKISHGQSRMTIENLSICWAPNIFRPKVETTESALHSAHMSDVFGDLIELLAKAEETRNENGN